MSTAATKRAPVATVIPKPCLKQALKLVSTACSQTKHAHFPPPSEEAKRYSGIEYDRTPIVVLTNELALPERGCPGRTFDDLDAHRYRHRTHHKSLSSVSEGSIPSSPPLLTSGCPSAALGQARRSMQQQETPSVLGLSGLPYTGIRATWKMNQVPLLQRADSYI
ncbi:hypothetical protein FRC15_008643 [Serendipita sp. 397]|nr:hypothetical protein FRC15_008643 [Serendipita sp. 397]